MRRTGTLDGIQTPGAAIMRSEGVKPTELVLLLVLATLWGASYTFIKIGVETIAPITLIAARTLIAAAVLMGVMHMRGKALPRDAATWRQFAVQSLLNSVVPFTLIAYAERSVDAGLAVILNAGTPIMAFLGTWLITRHESLTPRKAIGVIFGLAGTCWVVGTQALQDIGGQLMAQLAIVLATACYGAAAIYGRQFKEMDPMAPAAGSLICAAACMVPASALMDHPWTLAPSSASLMALLALSALSTALALVIYFRLVGSLGSLGTTAQAYLRVPIGVLIGMAFLHERLAPTTWLGLACTVVGVAAMVTPASKPSISR